MSERSRAAMSSEQLDLLWGAEAIGHYLGITVRKAYFLLERGDLPARKVGKNWVASRGNLRSMLHACCVERPSTSSNT
jgi:hypothetical protein